MVKKIPLFTLVWAIIPNFWSMQRYGKTSGFCDCFCLFKTILGKSFWIILMNLYEHISTYSWINAGLSYVHKSKSKENISLVKI